MEKLFTKGSRDHQMMGELIRFFQRYWIAETTDDYWQRLIEEAEQINQKYRDNTLLEILAGFVRAKEMETRKLREGGKT